MQNGRRKNGKKILIIAATAIILIAAVIVFAVPKVRPDRTDKPHAASSQPGQETADDEPINPVREDADSDDKTDTDEDGLPDSFESVIGTDVGDADTDRDGLQDGLEFTELSLDPLSVDTDENGVEDGDEDADGDGLTNAFELSIGTCLIFPDSDFDGIPDREEYEEYRTNPSEPDTDHDGVDDLTEVRLGSDPNKAETEFTSTAGSDITTEQSPVALEVEAVTDSDGADTVNILPITGSPIPALTTAAAGYLGQAYEITAEGRLDQATLTFTYDTSLEKFSTDFDPCIYYYNEDTGELEELPDQIKEGNAVSAQVSHFSIYLLLDKAFKAVQNLKLQNDHVFIDENCDGLDDEYAELLNDGKLLYQDSYALCAVLDMYGDSSDWDGDGLLNGEEIEITEDSFGFVRIMAHSNPLLVDSDCDGIDDYIEVKGAGTNPLKYDRKSVRALESLMNDSAYLYSVQKPDPGDNVALFLYGSKEETAKRCLAKYLSDYAPLDSQEEIAAAFARDRKNKEINEYLGLISNVACIFKSIYSVGSLLDTADELDGPRDELIQMEKNIYADINHKKTELVFDEISLLDLPGKITQIDEYLRSDDVFRNADAVTEIIKMLTKTGQIVTQAHEFDIINAAQQFRDYSKIVGADSALKTGSTFLNVAVNLAEFAVEEEEIAQLYGNLIANAEILNDYLGLLKYIMENAEDDYVRKAAYDVFAMVRDNGGSEYYSTLSQECGKDVIDLLVDSTLDILAKSNIYALIANSFLELYDKTGVVEQGQYNICFKVMSEVSGGCCSLLEEKIERHSQTFSYDIEDQGFVEDYLIQLAQSRIIGEYYFYSYCAQKTGASWLAQVFSGKSPDSYTKYYKTVAESIYGYANRLHLNLSNNLPYYELYWKDDVAEDELELSYNDTFSNDYSDKNDFAISEECLCALGDSYQNLKNKYGGIFERDTGSSPKMLVETEKGWIFKFTDYYEYGTDLDSVSHQWEECGDDRCWSVEGTAGSILGITEPVSMKDMADGISVSPVFEKSGKVSFQEELYTDHGSDPMPAYCIIIPVVSGHLEIRSISDTDIISPESMISVRKPDIRDVEKVVFE